MALAGVPAETSKNWTERIRRSLKPVRRIRFTREGKVFVGVTLGVGVAALNTGNNLLYLVLGLLLSIIILSGVLSEMSLRGLEFRRRLPRRAFSGLPMHVEIEVRNTKRFAPSYSIEVEDRIEQRRTDKRCYFLKVAAGARQTAAYRRTPPIRGKERYVSLRVATRFPFGLFEKWREVDLIEEQLVYPAPLRAKKDNAADQREGEVILRKERGSGDVDGVRELTVDEPVRDVDWKKTAAMGKLIARERRKEGNRLVRIDVANRAPESDREGFSAALELELRRVAFIALEALRVGTTVELRAEDAGQGAPNTLLVPPVQHGADRVLSFLALLPPEAAPPEPRYPEGGA